MSLPTDGTSLGSESVGGEIAPTVVTDSGGAADLPIDGTYLQDASYDRSGDDLVLNRDQDDELIVRDFFGPGDHSGIVTEDGHALDFDTVERLAGPLAPGQYAQAGPAPTGNAIGEVEDLTGDVSATHADGSIVELSEGDPVFKGDVIETGPDGAIGIRFVDDTTLALDAGARMVLNELVYNADEGSGAAVFSLIKGAMVFVSGEIAHSGPDAMVVNTPTATIGIRGTKVGVLFNIFKETLVDLFTPESIVAVWNVVGEYLLTGENPLLIFKSANEPPEVPEDADVYHSLFFGAERFLPQSADDDQTDYDLEGFQGRLARLREFLLDSIQGGPFLEDVAFDLTTIPLDPLGGTNFSFSSQTTQEESGTLDILINHPPVASPNEFLSQSGNLISDNTGMGVDSDPDGDDLMIVAVTTPVVSGVPGGAVVSGSFENGFTIETNLGVALLTIDGDGSFTLSIVEGNPFQGLAAGDLGSIDFTYTLSDGTFTDTADTSIGITGVDDPPIAVDDQFFVDEDMALTVGPSGVLSNDTDIDTGDAITVTSFSASSAEGGSVSVASDGSFTYVPSADFNGTDTFTYTIADSGGLTDSAVVTVTVTEVEDKLLVGDNDDNIENPAESTSQIDPHDGVDGDSPRLVGGIGDDVILGDIGGAEEEQAPGTEGIFGQNAIVILDRSGSMGGDRIVTAKEAILELSRTYATHAADAVRAGIDLVVKFAVIPFNSAAGSPIAVEISTSTITLATLDQFLTEIDPLTGLPQTGTGVFEFHQTAFMSFYDDLAGINASGGTNYLNPLNSALNILLTDNGLAAGDDFQPLHDVDGSKFAGNSLFFITDGVPSDSAAFNAFDAPTTSGAPVTAGNGLDFWRGIWTALGVEAFGINIEAPNAFASINRIDNTGGAENIDNVSQLGFAIQQTLPSLIVNPSPVGGDDLRGGAGNDVIFGDVIYTDLLSQSLIDGEGYAALLREIGGDPTTAEQVADYIRENADSLHLDNDPRGESDTIDGGAGSDRIFGQGGDDDIVAGTGADIVDGGTGDDTIRADDQSGSADGSIDTIVGGRGSDDLIGHADDKDIFIWRSGHRGPAGEVILSPDVEQVGPDKVTADANLIADTTVQYWFFEVSETTAVTFDGKSISPGLDMEFFLFADDGSLPVVLGGAGLLGALIAVNDNGAESAVGAGVDYGVASDGGSSTFDPFIVLGQLSAGSYVLAVSSANLDESSARLGTNVGTTGGSGDYQLTVTGENIELVDGPGLSETLVQNADDDVDTVIGFELAEIGGDELNLSDLLVGVPALADGAALDSFLNISINASGDTEIDVDYDGAANNADFDLQLKIVLSGLDNADWAAANGGSVPTTSEEFIDILLENNQLVV
ncbi:MAG: type I secretion C-terminal target domain-containing protein [Alphaproteobacteria bacterium]|nr:type I secretion C-terminal target domain-containing protein [Alphaproteobacteria bacterium]